MNNLFIRTSPSTFVLAQPYKTYALAVEAGQDLAGYGNFYVDTGTHVPSREEQLLEPIKPNPRRISAKQKLLNSI